MILFDKYAIKGTWDESPDPPDTTVILMPPIPIGIHGAGWHKSTQATLIALRASLKPGMSVIDFGAGSGIVAVAAAKLGAGVVYATERDQKAIDFAREVFEVNGVECEFLTDDLPPVDICIANVGKKINELLPHIQADLIIAVDGDGMGAFFTVVDGKKRVQMQYLLPDPPGQLPFLSFRGAETPAVEAVQQMLNYLTPVDIQAAMDVQFGPGAVKIKGLPGWAEPLGEGGSLGTYEKAGG